jgi:hypothetical protein
MFKIKKKITAPKPPILYNVIEDYSEFETPGNVTACTMTLQEDLAAHAKVLSESYEVPLETMTQLLIEGGVYVYPQVGGILTQGLFACRIDPTGALPKQTWTLDLMQFAEAEQLARARGIPLDEVAALVFHRTLPEELKTKLDQKNLGIDYRTLDRAVAKGGDIKYIDFRKDWSQHFRRLCIMPDGRLVETGGVEEFAQLHGITSAQAKTLVEQGGHARSERRDPGLSDCERSAGSGAVQREELHEGKGIGGNQTPPHHGCAQRGGLQRFGDDAPACAERAQCSTLNRIRADSSETGETGGKSATGATRSSKFWVRSSENFELRTSNYRRGALLGEFFVDGLEEFVEFEGFFEDATGAKEFRDVEEVAVALGTGHGDDLRVEKLPRQL